METVEAPDKVTQKITVRVQSKNQTTGKSENISGKEKEADFSGGFILPRKIVPCRNWTAISAKRNRRQIKQRQPGAYPKEEKADS